MIVINNKSIVCVCVCVWDALCAHRPNMLSEFLIAIVAIIIYVAIKSPDTDFLQFFSTTRSANVAIRFVNESGDWKESATQQLNEIVASKTPHVYRGWGKQQKGWSRVWKKWNDNEYLIKALGGAESVVSVFQQENQPRFVLESHTKSTHWVASAKPYSVSQNQTLEQLFAASSSNIFRYFVGELVDEQLLGDINNAAPLKLNDSTIKFRKQQNNVETNQTSYSTAMLWIGDKGVIANKHHDRSENFFVQVKGNKEFLIFPPFCWSEFHLFPIFSPSRRQVQYVKSTEKEDDAAHHENHSSICEAIRVVLQPGDLLYLPPFFFHEVTALDDSVSVSVVSPSLQEYFYSQVLYSDVDFSRARRVEERILAVVHFIRSFLQHLNIPADNFVNQLYRTRYSLLERTLRPELAFRDDPAPRRCFEISQRPEIRNRIESLLQPEFGVAIQKFDLMAQALFDGGSREILLHDLIEQLLLFVANNNPSTVVELLDECFRIDTVDLKDEPLTDAKLFNADSE